MEPTDVVGAEASADGQAHRADRTDSACGRDRTGVRLTPHYFGTEHRETLPLGSLALLPIERHERQARPAVPLLPPAPRPAAERLRRASGCASIRRSGMAAHDLDGRDFGPLFPCAEHFAARGGQAPMQRAARRGAGARARSRAPTRVSIQTHHRWVFTKPALDAPGLGLARRRADQRRAVPESHRPSAALREQIAAERCPAPAAARGGRTRSAIRRFPLARDRDAPACARRPSSSAGRLAAMATMRATGRSRSIHEDFSSTTDMFQVARQVVYEAVTILALFHMAILQPSLRPLVRCRSLFAFFVGCIRSAGSASSALISCGRTDQSTCASNIPVTMRPLRFTWTKIR